MKCIHCNTDSTYPERQAKDGRCKQCLHAFAFDTRANPEYKVSDGLFLRAIKDVSEDGKLWFTERQLCYELCRRLDKKSAGANRILSGIGIGFLCLVTGLASVATANPLPFLLGGVGGTAGIVARNRKKSKTAARSPELDPVDFPAKYLQRWCEVHGRPERLVETPVRPKRQVVYPKPQHDLTAFSFDRVLLTERADLAAMLVANNFHFENNCAILSLDGYPYDMRDVVMQMLGRNLNLKVFAIHDASISGSEMPLKLRQPEWFPEHAVQIMDLGLRPAHAVGTRLFVREHGTFPAPAPSQGTLTPEEAKWLEAGRAADLEQFRPTKLMRSIYQGFARANQAQATGADGGWDSGPGMIWIHDSRADVHAADSFG